MYGIRMVRGVLALALFLALAIGSSHQFRAARGEQLWRLV